MKLREFFSVVGGSYEKAMTRLMNDSFAIRFTRRSPNTASWCRQSGRGNGKRAFEPRIPSRGSR